MEHAIVYQGSIQHSLAFARDELAGFAAMLGGDAEISGAAWPALLHAGNQYLPHEVTIVSQVLIAGVFDPLEIVHPQVFPQAGARVGQ